MKKITALLLVLVMALSLVACGGSQGASNGPADFSKMTVTAIVPYDAGGGTDAVMRGWADAAKDSFKSITVENRSGAGGATGMLYGANAKNDGSILTMVTVELVTLEAMGNNAGLTYSQFKHVGYDGANGAITDLLGGHIDAVAVSYAEVSSFVESGDLKVLAVMSNERLDAIPDVPTAKECGYDAVLGTWRGLAVPASTSDEVVAELYNIFSAAADSDAFKEFMGNTNNVIEIMDGAAFTAMMADQLELYTGLVEDLGLKVG